MNKSINQESSVKNPMSTEAASPPDSQLLQTITSGKHEDRIKSYSIIIRKCSTENQPDFDWSLMKNELAAVLKAILEDMNTENQNNEDLQACVGMVGYIMSRAEFTKLLPIVFVEEIADTVLKIAKKTTDKKILIRILWGFAMEKYPHAIYNLYCDKLVDTVIDALQAKQSSVAVYESLRLLLFLLKSLGSTVSEKCIDFYPEVFPQMFHSAPRIRKLALACTGYLVEQPDTLEVLNGIVEKSVKDIVNIYSPTLVKLVSEETLNSLLIWQVCIKMLGRKLHTGTTLINSLLVVVEKAFKSNSTAIRVEAFNCWARLIDNFSLDMNVLTSSKRLKLVIAPFMANNAKSDDIIKSKLLSWFHFIKSLKNKAQDNFDMIVLPFLHFCFKYQKTLSATSPKAAGLALKNLAMANSSASAKISSDLKVKFVHVFYQFMAPISSRKNTTLFCNMETLESDLMSASIYSKHHQLLHECYKEALRYTSTITSPQSMGTNLTEALMTHLLSYIESSSVREAADVLKEIMASFSELLSESKVNDSLSSVLLEAFSVMMASQHKLPAKVLYSRQYHSGSMLSAGGVMRGSIACSFISMMLTETMMHTAYSAQSRYQETWSELLSNYQGDDTGYLAYLKNCCSSLSSSISSYICNADQISSYMGGQESAATILSKLWRQLSVAMRKHIKECQVIDAGDSMDHDFSAVYSVLTLPLTHSASVVKLLSKEELMSTSEEWCLLYDSFSHLAPLSKGAENNIECEYICKNILAMLSASHMAGPSDMHLKTLLFTSNITETLTEHFRYQQIGKTVRDPVSPLKSRSKSSTTLCSLSPLLEVLSVMWGKVLRLVGVERKDAAKSLATATHSVLMGVKSPKIIAHLLNACVELCSAVLQVNPAARYGSEVETAILEMWDVFCTLTEEHICSKRNGVNPAMLDLIKTGLNSTNNSVMKRTRRVWLSLDHSSLKISDDLMRLLKQCELPPAVNAENEATNSNGTPKSKTSNNPKTADSKVNSVTSPKGNLIKPFCKTHTPKSAKKSSRTSLSINDIDEQEFVVIKSPANLKKRPLTPHQKEKMAERRCDIPALYSDLSQQFSQSLQYSDDSSSRTMSKDSLPKEDIKLDAVEPMDVDESVTDTNEKNRMEIVDSEKKINQSNDSISKGSTVDKGFDSDSDSENEIPDSQCGSDSRSSLFTPKTTIALKTFASSTKIDGIEPLRSNKRKVPLDDEVSKKKRTETLDKSLTKMTEITDSSSDEKDDKSSSDETSNTLVTPSKEKRKSIQGTPNKITRSGRKIVAPDKDMPKPMTVTPDKVKSGRRKSLMKLMENSACPEQSPNGINISFGEEQEITIKMKTVSNESEKEFVDESKTPTKNVQKKISEIFKPRTVYEECSEELQVNKSQTCVGYGRAKDSKFDELVANDDGVTPDSTIDEKESQSKTKESESQIAEENNICDLSVLEDVRELEDIEDIPQSCTENSVVKESDSKSSDVNTECIDDENTDKDTSQKEVATDEEDVEQQTMEHSEVEQTSSDVKIDVPEIKVNDNAVVEEAFETPKISRRNSNLNSNSVSKISSVKKVQNLSKKSESVDESPVTKSKRGRKRKIDAVGERVVTSSAKRRNTRSSIETTVDVQLNEYIILRRNRKRQSVANGLSQQEENLETEKVNEDDKEESEKDDTKEREEVSETKVFDKKEENNDVFEGFEFKGDEELKADDNELKGEDAITKENKEADDQKKIDDQKELEEEVFEKEETNEISEVLAESDQKENETNVSTESPAKLIASASAVAGKCSPDGKQDSQPEVSDEQKDKEDGENEQEVTTAVEGDNEGICADVENQNLTTDKIEQVDEDGYVVQSLTTESTVETEKQDKNSESKDDDQFILSKIEDGSFQETPVKDVVSKTSSSLPKPSVEHIASDKSSFSSPAVASDRRKSTPTLRVSGSRAARMVACAQLKANVRYGPSTPYPPSRKSTDVLACDMLDSPSRKTPTGSVSTPPSSLRRNRLSTPVSISSERPWAKHQPSPAASPSTSILKKSVLDSANKSRRVSFADPPVSESVEIPSNTKETQRSLSLSLRAQKRLDMGASPKPLTIEKCLLPQQPSKQSLAQLLPNQNDTVDEDELNAISCSQGIYSALTGCSDPVSAVLDSLTSPCLVPGLLAVLNNRGVMTVGHLANLTDSDVAALPVKDPKVKNVLSVLKEYELRIQNTLQKETPTSDDSEAPPMEVDSQEESTGSSMTVEEEETLSDKENQTPPKKSPIDSDKLAVESKKVIYSVERLDEKRDVLSEVAIHVAYGLDGEDSQPLCDDKHSTAKKTLPSTSTSLPQNIPSTSTSLPQNVPTTSTSLPQNVPTTSTSLPQTTAVISSPQSLKTISQKESVCESSSEWVENLSSLPMEKREEVMQTLMKSLPYTKVLDTFFAYLKERRTSEESME